LTNTTITMDQDFIAEYQPYIFLAVGLILLILSAFGKSAKSKLKQTGIPVEGIVFEQDYDDSSNRSVDNSSSFEKDKITIRFVTETGEWITGVLKQDFRIFYTGQYKNGDTIKVYYNKDNPSDFYVDTKQSGFAGRLVMGFVGLIFLLIGPIQALCMTIN
jgi:hypothetical protein